MASLQANNETARLEALDRYEILDTACEEIFDNLVYLAAQICQTPIAAINLVDAKRQWFKSSVGLELRELPRDVGLCPFCVEQREELIINDTLADERFATNRGVTSYPNLRFYAGVPLITASGEAIGVLWVGDRKVRNLSAKQVEALRILSRQVIKQLETRHNLLALKRSFSPQTDDLEIAAVNPSNLEKREGEICLKSSGASVEASTQHQQLVQTVQQLVEKALWENQRFIQKIADATPAILYIYDLIEEQNIYANRQVTEILGYSPEAIQKMGIGFITLLHPDDSALVNEKIQRWKTAKDGEILEIEYRMQHASGEWRWLYSRETVFTRTTDGLVQQILGTASDITKRKEAEEELRESKERFQGAFEAAAIGIALVSPAGKWLSVNNSLCEMLGYSESELLETTWDAIAHRDDLEPDLNYVRQILDSELRSCHMEKRYFHKTGQIVWVLLSMSLVRDAGGGILYFVVQVQDITKRKEAEDKISEQAALLDVTTDAILVQSLDHRILFWNKGAERLYGWKTKEALGKNAEQLLYKQIYPEVAAARVAVLSKGEWQGELKKVTKEGNEIIVQSRWTLMRDEAGKPKAILSVNTDITENKKLEAQFLRTQRLESIGTLAGGIAHDLNNVLAPILMAVQLLEKKLPDEQSQRLLDTLETNAKRGADLVKQILSFARGIEAKRTIVQVRHLIAEIKHIAKETFPKSIEFNTDIPRDLWTLCGDATQLHQVFLNLCVNARDAMPLGGILTLAAENKFIDENYARMHLEVKVGPYIVISVSDTGTGIPPDILDRIFEPFFTTKELGKGTGLGLSTVTGIVKSHGGFVQVNSQVGSGTQFKVFLPAIETNEIAQVQETFQALPGGKGELILVVDDEAAIREITKESLETYAYKVLSASDGIEAIALYAQHRQQIALVLVDMMMPSMDGATTIRLLQKMNPNIKIIAVSGLMSNYKFDQVEDIGIKAFLSKPYTAKELFNTIKLVISK